MKEKSMNYKLPKLLYSIRAVLFVSLLLSFLFLNKATSAVVFMITVVFDCCDFYITKKYFSGKLSLKNDLIFQIIDRCTVLLPLLFFVIYGMLSWWVYLIVVAFEVVIFYNINFINYQIKQRRVRNVFYVLYNLVIYSSIILYLLCSLSAGVYSLFVAEIFACVVVIISSIMQGDETEMVEEDKQTEASKENTEDQIVE